MTSVLGKMNYGGNATATASGSSSTNSNQTYSGTEEKSAQSKEFAEQVQAADTAMQKYQEISAMQDSWGKSASMPYQDLARRLSSSGAIADINAAKEGLKGKMSDSAYQQIAADAQHEINTSSAQDIMGYDREALSGFLMLNEADPVAAAEIMNNHLTPAANGSGVTMSPDSHKDLKKSPENIVSKDQAEGFRSKAHKGEVNPGDNNMGSGAEGSNEGGQANKESAPETATNNAKKEVDNDNDTGSGAEGSNGRGQSAKTATPQMATHSGHSPKAASGTKSSNSSSINKDSGGKSSKSGGQSTPTPKISWAKDPQESAAQPKGGHSSNVSQPLDNAVNGTGVSDHAGLRDQIEKGGKLDGKFDGTAALNRSGGAVGDVVKKIAMDGFNEDVNLAKNVASDFVDIAKNSANSGVKFVDNIQNSIESGVKKLTGSNEPSDGAHKNKSDNDLPPTPKD